MAIFLLIGVMALSASAIFVKLANAPSSIIAFYRIFISFCFISVINVSLVSFYIGMNHNERQYVKTALYQLKRRIYH